MNTSFRFAVVAVAAFLFSLTSNIVLAAPADQLALRWSELQPVLKGRQIPVHLTDGATVEGRHSSLQAGVLSIHGTKTSDPAKHPKGATRLARPELAQPSVKRHSGWQGRTMASELPLVFERNEGQLAAEVLFLWRGPTYTTFLMRDGVVFAVARKDGEPDQIGMKLAGSRMGTLVEGEDRLPGTVNYFLGKDPAGWRTNIATYARVKYREVYRGVDISFYGRQNRIEYDFELAPRADPSAIRVEFEGGEIVDGANGDLEVRAGKATLLHLKPVAWQETARGREAVAARFVRRDGGGIGFEVDPYEPSLPLVIDPVVVWETGLRWTPLPDPAKQGIAVDLAGNTYVTGFASGSLYTTPNVVQGTFTGRQCAFVTKVAYHGGNYVYSTYLGGDGISEGHAIAVDYRGFAYVTGYNSGSDFPTTSGAFQTTGSATSFVSKLNPQGTALVYSTLLGGSGTDVGNAIAIDGLGNAYVAGLTSSPDFPTNAGSFQTGSPTVSRAFVVKLDATGEKLVYSTLLGGSDGTGANGIAVDRRNNAYVTGGTSAADFPVTPGAYQGTMLGGICGERWVNGQRVPYRCGEGFVARLSGTGEVDWATFLGGSKDDQPNGLAIDDDGNAYVTGSTASLDFPVTAGAYLGFYSPNPLTGYAAKVAADGSKLVYSTFLGGGPFKIGLDEGRGGTGIAVDTSGAAFIPYREGLGKLSPDGKSFELFTTPGDAHKVALDTVGNAYVSGYRAVPLGEGVFIAKLQFQSAPEPPSFTSDGVVNAASLYPVGQVAPGEIVTIFGSGFGSSELTTLRLDAAGRASVLLGDTAVFFDDVPAPLIYVAKNQLSAVVPYSVEVPPPGWLGWTRVTIQYRGVMSEWVRKLVGDVALGVFTQNASGSGPGAILNQDSSLNTPKRPARPGEVISIYATGEGRTDPPGVDGVITTQPLPKPVLPVTATVGGLPAEVLYAGAAPGAIAGLFQVNVRVPANVRVGDAIPMYLTVGRFSSQPVDVAIAK